MPPTKNPIDVDGEAPNHFIEELVLFTPQEVVCQLFSRGGIIKGGSTKIKLGGLLEGREVKRKFFINIQNYCYTWKQCRFWLPKESYRSTTGERLNYKTWISIWCSHLCLNTIIIIVFLPAILRGKSPNFRGKATASLPLRLGRQPPPLPPSPWAAATDYSLFITDYSLFITDYSLFINSLLFQKHLIIILFLFGLCQSTF